MNDILISINSKNKVQIIELSLNDNFISRSSYQFLGKKIQQPNIPIIPKSNRSIIQQASLEYNSILKKYLDKGYKKLSDLSNKSLNSLSELDLLALLGSFKTNQFNVPKPMLAFPHDKCNKSIFNNPWLASKKLDGIRCLIGINDNVFSLSRGGIEFTSTKKIKEDQNLLNFLNKNPSLILDGELYNKNLSLQELSGLSRLKEFNDKCNDLQFHVYDVICNEPFSKRLQILNSLIPSNLIKIVDHIQVNSLSEINDLHNQFILDGYEGLVLRNPNKEYGVGKRSSSYMIKVKDYQDLDAKVISYKLGLRGIEDVVFICQLNSGIQFEAKPIGPLSIKEEYVNNFNSKYINSIANIKYFNLYNGIPQQPVFKHFRSDY